MMPRTTTRNIPPSQHMSPLPAPGSMFWQPHQNPTHHADEDHDHEDIGGPCCPRILGSRKSPRRCAAGATHDGLQEARRRVGQCLPEHAWASVVLVELGGTVGDRQIRQPPRRAPVLSSCIPNRRLLDGFHSRKKPRFHHANREVPYATSAHSRYHRSIREALWPPSVSVLRLSSRRTTTLVGNGGLVGRGTKNLVVVLCFVKGFKVNASGI